MFEQTVIHEQRSPWAFAASLTMQTAMAAGVVLLSIVTVDRLPNVELPVPMPPLSRAPVPVELVDTGAARAATTAAPATRVFTAPSRVPDRVAMVMDDLSRIGAPVPAIDGIAGTGLPPGLYSGTPLYRVNPFERVTPPPPPAPPAETQVAPVRTIRLGGQVMEAKLVRRVMPEYPRLARDMRITGTVKLVGIVSRDGTVRELKVIEGHPLLVKAAVAAVMQWLYPPTLLNGDPVDVIAPIEVHFTLR
jgi:protein TonB